MTSTGLLEKKLNDDGMYELKINGHLMFRATDNETIKIIGDAIVDMSEAGDNAIMVIGKEREQQ